VTRWLVILAAFVFPVGLVAWDELRARRWRKRERAPWWKR